MLHTFLRQYRTGMKCGQGGLLALQHVLVRRLMPCEFISTLAFDRRSR